MSFSVKLRQAMKDCGLNQKQVCGMTGKSRGSVSQYLSGSQVPKKETQREIALALGLDEDYFEDEGIVAAKALVEKILDDSGIVRMKPTDAARLLGVCPRTVQQGLQQGVFPWGYAVRTSEKKWTYIINAKRFVEIEGIAT